MSGRERERASLAGADEADCACPPGQGFESRSTNKQQEHLGTMWSFNRLVCCEACSLSQDHIQGVTCLAFHPTNPTLFSGSSDKAEFSVFHSLSVLLASLQKREAVKIFDLTRPPGHKKAGVFGSITPGCLKTWRFERHMNRMKQSKSIRDKSS